MQVRSDHSSAATSPGPSSDGASGVSAGTSVGTLRERLALRVHYSTSPFGGVAGEVPLAAIHFGSAPVSAGAHPTAQIFMEPLAAAAGVEVWTSELPVEYGEFEGIRYAQNGEVMFGVVSDPVMIASADFEERVHQLYRVLFRLIEAQGCPHLLRMWNYFPDINGHFARLENYQRFCRARAAAFQDHFRDFIPRLPSASAIGTHSGPLVVYFIAAREPGRHRENPRQLSAYSYPPQYGPRSPSFARGTLKRVGASDVFFVSGTASIVGHESLHRGDARAQLEETLRNIEALLESTRRDEGVALRGLADITHMKVYLRQPADLAVVRDLLDRRLGVGTEVMYLHGDICRRELLVEIEAFAGR